MTTTELSLRCPLCNRVIAPPSIDDPTQLREAFVRHAGLQHGVSEVDGLVYFAEAMRRYVGRPG